MTTSLLDIFHKPVKRWFENRFSGPTAAQRAAWPKIAAGEHVLVTAPTGSGKTLTAFLYAIDKLASGTWTCDAVRVLYVSPLKALNNDIRKNLIEPVEEIRAVFAKDRQEMPDIRVMTRSGDTPESERRTMVVKPPSILITTPESLNILLTSRRGQNLFFGIKTVILDEVHAVAAFKRGTHLMCAVERIAVMSGEFQRIALSATINPADRIARFVGGYRPIRSASETHFEPREVTLVRPLMDKSYALGVSYVLPETKAEDATGESADAAPKDSVRENPVWRAAAEKMADIILDNRSTLVFANSRRGVERMARLINEIAQDSLVFAHHGSLSREIREVVESRLREGALKGVVATNSLELGIDVGTVDKVLLLEAPPSIASFMQRLGRAGHRVGEVSCGQLFALHPQDLINAAVCAAALKDGEPEPLSPPELPLDVLAQVILSMTAVSPMRLDDIYDAVRAADPYVRLPRRMFDLVVEMLAGKYEGLRIPALRPRLAVDRIEGTAEALPSAVRALFSSGGTIPDRGYYTVRVKDKNTPVGELDEEFVWERKIGDIITLGVQSWRIEDIGYSDVIVAPHCSKAVQPPFWTCEERGTSAYFALKRSALLEQAENRLNDPAFVESLMTEHLLDEAAARELVRYLKYQRSASDGSLPHRHQIVIEHVMPASSNRMALTVIHTEWGGKINRPFGIALKAALFAKSGLSVRVMNDDIAVAVACETFFSAPDLIGAVTASNARSLVRETIRETGFFGASFRENAARSLLLLKAGFGRRTPLWLNRKRAKELRVALAEHTDFPVTLETYRACLNDEIDLDALDQRLLEIESGLIHIQEIKTDKPTPFAEPVLHKLSNELVYESDVSTDQKSDAADVLIDEVLFSDALRPKISRTHASVLADKLTRIYPGYSPSCAAELLEWIKERILIPKEEWIRLLFAMSRDHDIDKEDIVGAVSHRAIALVPDESDAVIVAVENLPKIAICRALTVCTPMSIALDGAVSAKESRAAQKKSMSMFQGERLSLEELLLELLRFVGPVPVHRLEALLSMPRQDIESAVSGLARDDLVIVDRITEDASALEVCHVDSFRILLRMARAEASRSLATRPANDLPLFIAVRQKLVLSKKSRTLEDAMEPLFGVAATPDQWEQEILPARLPGYRIADLDALLASSGLQWTLQKDETAVFCLADERDLFFSKKREQKDAQVLNELFPEPFSRFTLADLAKRRPNAVPGEIENLLFDLASKECISANTFHPARQGRETYALCNRLSIRRLSSRWKRNEEDRSVWYRLEAPDTDRDALDEESLCRDRVRVLLDRFGVLFRELLERELPLLKWSAVFRTLRLMELSGEIIGGHFFEGVPGIQFIAKDAVCLLQNEIDSAPVYWMNAKDPASLCGVKIGGLSLPPRIQGTHLVYCKKNLVLISKRRGRNLTFHVEPDDPRMSEYLDCFCSMLTRDRLPAPRISIEKINDKRARTSPFRPVFEACFDTFADSDFLNIMKRYGGDNFG